MKKIVLDLLNPFRYLRAVRYHRSQKKFNKVVGDLELTLYANILSNDMLHLGFFDNPGIAPEDISLADVERAQIRYAEVISEQVHHKDTPVLDLGCGMGGLAGMLMDRGYQVECLTPHRHQAEYVAKKYPNATVHQTQFETFRGERKFGTIINSESLQYIELPNAVAGVESLLLPDGRWIVADLFRLGIKEAINNTGHLLDGFLSQVTSRGWTIIHQRDITANVLPTLRLLDMYSERLLKPLTVYALEYLHNRQAWLWHLLGDMRNYCFRKLDKEIAAIDPRMFLEEKKYMLFVLRNDQK